MDTVGDLLRLIDRPAHAAIRERMRAVILRRRGLTLSAIGVVLGRPETWVKRWNDRFKSGGFDGLQNRHRPGSKPRLSPENEARLGRRIEALNGHVRTLADVRELLESEFAAHYSRSGTAGILRRLGFVKLRPRPRHPGSDSARQDEFVAKTLPLFMRKPVGSIPASALKSGSRTNPALGNKDA